MPLRIPPYCVFSPARATPSISHSIYSYSRQSVHSKTVPDRIRLVKRPDARRLQAGSAADVVLLDQLLQRAIGTKPGQADEAEPGADERGGVEWERGGGRGRGQLAGI